MRTLLASLVLGLALWSASPASAQLELEPCLENPVQCAVDTVDEVTGTVDETVKEITGTVGEVTDPVNDVVNPGGEDPSPPGGTTEAGGSSGAGGRSGGPGPRGRIGTGLSEPTGTARPGTGARRVERPAPPREAIEPAGDALDRIRRTLSGSTETLAFPLALIIVLGAFLLLQGRVDRSDPKLALAPVEPDDDILSFG